MRPARELFILQPPPVSFSASDRNMGKQLWDSRLHVHDEAEQSIDFTGKVCCELLVNVYVCVKNVLVSLSLSLSLFLCVINVLIFKRPNRKNRNGTKNETDS